MNTHLRLVIFPHKPWIIINKSIDRQYCEGIQCDLLKYVSKSMNFSYEFIIEKSVIGWKLQNNSWNGMIGKIDRNVCQFNNIDLAHSIISIR